MALLDLDVLDYRGPTQWRWRLTDLAGRFIADHEVALDRRAWQYEAFCDLHGYLSTFVAPDRKLASGTDLLESVGQWIAEEVLGPIAGRLAALRPATVRLKLPSDAAILGLRPVELAWVGGRPLTMQDVSFVFEFVGIDSQPKVSVGDRLRVLGVFSLPVDRSALNLRRERHELVRLIHEVAQIHHKSIELRVLQYGVTRDLLADVLLEAPGWDVVHISGHGAAGSILLECEDGSHDIVDGAALVSLLEPAKEQIKLVTLSACNSGASTAAEHLRTLGVNPSILGVASETDPPAARTLSTNDAGDPASSTSQLTSMATEITGRIGCAVLAMRYPVGDEFAIALSGRLYDLMFGKGHVLPRALQLALPRVVSGLPTFAIPPLSVVTPALFGEAAIDLRLLPPPAAAIAFDPADIPLAGFKDQADRFVGRVGSMARANAALAKRSGASGVLFYGMAGVGKTTCALELAYGHTHDFPWQFWYHVPEDKDGIGAALATFAQGLDAKIPGLGLEELVGDERRFNAFLPQLREVFKQTRKLVVIDNVESLLTDEGAWRDRRWESLIGALVSHNGLSRVILTSRVRAQQLDDRVLTEPLHALSLEEAVLLARELPNLRRLLDGAVQGREELDRALIARTLAIVQGHPILIQLAEGQAADPLQLEARLAEADRAWLNTSTRIEAFLEQGTSLATAEDYLRVLGIWTRGTTEALSPSVRTLFQVLCTLEDADRSQDVVESVWPGLWIALGTREVCPDLSVSVASLVAHGLVATDDLTGRSRRSTIYRIHAGLATTGQASTSPPFRSTVRTQLAAFWLDAYQVGLEEEGKGRGTSVVHAGSRAVPYLLSVADWRSAATVIRAVLERDSSLSRAASLLGPLQSIAEATVTTDQALEHGRLLAKALSRVQPVAGEAQLRELLPVALDHGQLAIASNLAGDLIDLLVERGDLAEALTLAERKAEYTRESGVGPWSILADTEQRLRIQALEGHNQKVYDSVETLLQTMAELPEEAHGALTAALPWKVREALLGLGSQAADNLQIWGRALAWNARRIESMRRRGAPPLEIAKVHFDDYFMLLNLQFVADAKSVLLECRQTFEDHDDPEWIGRTLNGLALVEEYSGHRDNAIRLAGDALRHAYTAQDPRLCAASHYNLANFLRRARLDPTVAIAHRLASAIAELQMGLGSLNKGLHLLARALADPDGKQTAPASFTEVTELVDQIEGVHFGQLFENLPRRYSDGEAALAEVLRLVNTMPSDDVTRTAKAAAAVGGAAVMFSGGDQSRAMAVASELAMRGNADEDALLVARLGAITSGERDAGLLQGLDEAQSAVVQAGLAALEGSFLNLEDLDSIRSTAMAAIEMLPEDLQPALRQLFDSFDSMVPDDAPVGDIAEAFAVAVADTMPESVVSGMAVLLRRMIADDPVVAPSDLAAGLDSTEGTKAALIESMGKLVPRVAKVAFTRQLSEIIVEGVVLAAHDDTNTMRAMIEDDLLTPLSTNPLFDALASSLRRIMDGERGHELTNDLDEADKAIIVAVLARLDNAPRSGLAIETARPPTPNPIDEMVKAHMDFRPRLNTNNPDPRIACILLLDTSDSMSGHPIAQLNAGFRQFCDAIKKDDLARKRAEIMVITFGGSARVEIPFTEGRELQPRELAAGGNTPMGAALHLGLDELERQKQAYRMAGLEYYRPWLFVLTDGEPTDASAYSTAIERIRQVEVAKGVSVFAIGVGSSANLERLKPLSTQRVPVMLDELRFGKFFEWLSASLSAASASNAFSSSGAGVGNTDDAEQILLPPVGWARA